MKFGKGYEILMMVLIAGCLLCGCEKRKSESENMIAGNTKEIKDTNQETREQWEKGYNLPLDEAEQEEAATQCKEMMKKIQDIYKSADKGTASNAVLQDETMLGMQKAMMETGSPVSATVPYSDMENYENAEQFLIDCEKGKSGSVIIYDVHQDGGICRMKFSYDGTDMYVVSTSGVWMEGDKPGIAYTSYTRIK